MCKIVKYIWIIMDIWTENYCIHLNRKRRRDFLRNFSYFIPSLNLQKLISHKILKELLCSLTLTYWLYALTNHDKRYICIRPCKRSQLKTTLISTSIHRIYYILIPNYIYINMLCKIQMLISIYSVYSKLILIWLIY